MTSEQNPESPEPTEPVAVEPEPQEADEVEQVDDLAAVRHEAKQRRLALRAVEAERDELRAWREARERQDVEVMAADRLAKPDDLFLATSLEVMRGEDGLISMEKAEEEINRVVEERPHWRKQERTRIDLHQGARPMIEDRKPSFGKAIRKTLGS